MQNISPQFDEILLNTSIVRSMLSNQQPATSNQQPATSNQQPATSNQQPATSNQQPATSNSFSFYPVYLKIFIYFSEALSRGFLAITFIFLV